ARQALATCSRLAPGSLLTARVVNLLGACRFVVRDLDAAERLYREAMAIEERCGSPCLEDVALSAGNPGILAPERGDLLAAEADLRRNLSIFELRAPGTGDEAVALSNLANVELDRGNLEAAEQLQRRALAILERSSPASMERAGVLTNLGSTLAT